MKLKSLLLLFCLLFCFDGMAQTAEKLAKEKDSLRMFRNIENYSRKRGFTRFLHRLVFKPVTKKTTIKKNTFQKIKKPNLRTAEGKIIRHINIYTLDPFGYSELDSTKKPTRWVYKAGNAMHNKTRDLAIKNLLLIKRNRPLDSLLLLESQRLIRSQRFVRAVNVYTKLAGNSPDSVDVYIRVLDSWSLIPDFTASSSRMDVILNERNFVGMGHQFRNSYQRSFTTNDQGYSSLYSIPSIMNTYVNATASYKIDLDDNMSKFINVERPFFSPYARWAAGVYLDQQLRNIPIFDSLGVESRDTYRYNTSDFWAGHSYQIFKGSSEKSRTTNFITAARYLNVNYLRRPASDSVGFFTDEKFYMVGLGISSRQFVQDKFLFNYNIVEDVPTGMVYGLTGGYQAKNGINRFYAGGRFAYGRYFSFGYLSTDIEYGTFFRHGRTQQSAFVYRITYFTNLIETTGWKFRQFIKPEIVIGNHRLNTAVDQVNLNEDLNGIPGFKSDIYGSKKLLLTLQTQGYSPWSFLGFRFNPFVGMSFGMLGNASGWRDSRLFSQFGGGFIISNDYLVFSSFQLSFSYYPSMPGNGENLFKTNSLKTSDFTLQEFDISKPRIVPYQ